MKIKIKGFFGSLSGLALAGAILVSFNVGTVVAKTAQLCPGGIVSYDAICPPDPSDPSTTTPNATAKTAPIKQNLDGTCTQDGKTITCPSNSSLIEPSYTRSALIAYCKTHLKSPRCKNTY